MADSSSECGGRQRTDHPGGAAQDANALFRELAPRVARLLRKCGVPPDELDDAVQEVFLVAHARGGYEPGPALAFTWLAEIGVRVAFAQRRKRRARAVEEPNERAIRRMPSHVTPIHDVEAVELVRLLQGAFASLPIETARVFILCEFEGQSCEAVARVLKVPVGTVYSRLHAARKAFSRAASQD